MISWPISMKECSRTRAANLRPSAYQAEAHLTELVGPAMPWYSISLSLPTENGHPKRLPDKTLMEWKEILRQMHSHIHFWFNAYCTNIHAMFQMYTINALTDLEIISISSYNFKHLHHNCTLKEHIWAMSWENLFMMYANNKGADQSAHPRSLISSFVVHCLVV